MRPLQGRLLAGLFMLLPLSALAEPIGYVTAFNSLYRIDLDSGQSTLVGPLGFNDVDGLAFSADGSLYGVADASAGSGSAISDLLIRINTTTGAGTLVGALPGLSGTGPSGQLDYGLAFTCSGQLWLSSDTTGQFWEVNPGNAAVRYVGNTGRPISGLAARGNELFGVGVRLGFGDASHQSLYRIDRTSAEATLVGSLGVGDTLSGAGADFDASGVLWATLDSQPPDVNRASRVARIDVATGAAMIVANAQGVQDNLSLRGLAIAPTGGCTGTGDGIGGGNDVARQVPGPGLPVLVLLGGLALMTGLRRMRVA